MTDERFEQLMKQALKPEIDERDVVIQKNTNNYKNRMKRKRRLRVCITAGIAAAACVVAGVQLNRFGNGQVPYTETKQDFVTNKTSSAFSPAYSPFDYPLNLHISQTSNLINGLSFRVDKFKRC